MKEETLPLKDMDEAQRTAFAVPLDAMCGGCGLIERLGLPDAIIQDPATGRWFGVVDEYACSECGSQRGAYLR